jgi:hypothetical protein
MVSKAASPSSFDAVGAAAPAKDKNAATTGATVRTRTILMAVFLT